MSVTRDELEDLVSQGLVADIFKAERAHHLLIAISDKASILNNRNTGNFGELFGTFQDALQTDAVLAVARLYDKPSTKYPTRCIHGVLDYLESHCDQLPDIREIPALTQHLQNAGFNREGIELASTDGAAFALALVKHYRAILNDQSTLNLIDDLKAVRDKVIAHNEQVSGIAGPTWNGLSELIETAKGLVGILGWAYFGTAYIIDGQYVRTEDAMRPSRALHRLVDRILNNAEHERAT